MNVKTIRRMMVFFLDEKIKSEAKPVKIDTIGFFEDLILPQKFFVYQDTFLIVLNYKYEDVYFVEFYDLRRQQLLHQFFRLGNGPYEMLSAIVRMNGNILIVNDFVKSQVAFVNIDSVLHNPLYSVPVISADFGDTQSSDIIMILQRLFDIIKKDADFGDTHPPLSVIPVHYLWLPYSWERLTKLHFFS